jgi:hypothetical protein
LDLLASLDFDRDDGTLVPIVVVFLDLVTDLLTRAVKLPSSSPPC